MGCKSTKNTGAEFLYSEKIRLMIENNEDKQLDMIITPALISINSVFYKENDLDLSPLAYAFFKTKVRSFIHLHKHFNASVCEMEKLFYLQGYNPILIACKSGNLELFSYYIEHYTPSKSIPHLKVSPKETFVLQSLNNIDLQRCPLLAVQLLCELGYIHLLSYIVRYVKTIENIPDDFNINAVNEVNGENCALIACRKVNYTLIKFLNTIGADFSQKNKLKENALQVLCSSNRKKPKGEVVECFSYLLFSVKVDVEYNYEETLLLIEDEKLVEIYENKLKDVGITVKKCEIEEKYGIYVDNNLKASVVDINNVTFSSLYRSEYSSFLSALRDCEKSSVGHSEEEFI